MAVHRTRRVALLVEEDFDEAQVLGLLQRLRDAGIEVVVVGPLKDRHYTARRSTATVTSDLAAGAARCPDFDAVVVPGGYAPDRMRMRHPMVDLVRDMATAGKPVAAVDHGPQLLISANVVRGRTLTCWPSIAIDVKNAGGRYVDRPVVEDGPLITARKLDDVPALAVVLLRALGVEVSTRP
jgi:protease I